jgi:hypothetical protein
MDYNEKREINYIHITLLFNFLFHMESNMQHRHEHTGDVNVKTDVGEEIKSLKEHFQKHKRRYLEAAGALGVAGFTCLIMRGVASQHIGCGISVSADRGISVIADRSVVRDNIFLISSRRQGAPSWVVRCLETGGIFPSQLSVAKEMGLSSSEISKHLNGVMDDVRGFHFERIAMAA